MISLLFFGGCLEGNLKEIHVNINGGGDFKNIQEAIENVVVGGTIYVGEGVYHELLIINKSINLIGQNNGKTIIIQSNFNSNYNSIIQIKSDNCLIRGFNIISNKGTINGIDVIGINISSSNNTISYNIINGSGKGIYINKKTNNNISNNIISNTSNGIYTFNTENNKIFKNNLSSCGVYGIYIFGSDNNTISNNIVFDSDYGLRIKGSMENKVFKNYIFRNKQGLLCCCGAANNIIYNNIFKQNQLWNAEDDATNQWDNGFFGNYWDDYTTKYQNATEINGIWNLPYEIKFDSQDRYPLVYQPEI